MTFEAKLELEYDVGLETYEIQESAKAELARSGFVLPAPPVVISEETGEVLEFKGELPPNITQLSDTQLGSELDKQAKWANHVDGEVALARMCYVVAKAQLEFTAAKIRLQYKTNKGGKKLTKQEREDMLQVDRRFVQTQSRLIYFESVYRLVEAIGKAAERNFNLVSRRITQRGNENDRDRRTGAVSNARFPSFPKRGGLG